MDGHVILSFKHETYWTYPLIAVEDYEGLSSLKVRSTFLLPRYKFDSLDLHQWEPNLLLLLGLLCNSKRGYYPVTKAPNAKLKAPLNL
jgi:hypothetical protein